VMQACRSPVREDLVGSPPTNGKKRMRPGFRKSLLQFAACRPDGAGGGIAHKPRLRSSSSLSLASGIEGLALLRCKWWPACPGVSALEASFGWALDDLIDVSEKNCSPFPANGIEELTRQSFDELQSGGRGSCGASDNTLANFRVFSKCGRGAAVPR